MTNRGPLRLDDVITLEYGKSLAAHLRIPGAVPVFGSNGCVGSHTEAIVSGPGIVIGRKGSVGEVNFSAESFWPIDTTYFVQRKRNDDWRFLFHLLRQLDLTQLNSHSAIPGLNRENVYSIEVSLPELREQQLIARALDLVERCSAAESASIETATALKRAAMRELFRRGLRGSESTETSVGRFPVDWRESTLGALCSVGNGVIQTGPFGSQLHASDYQLDGVPVVNPTHLNGNRISHEGVPLISNEKAQVLARHATIRGDILFGRRGEIGRHGLVGIDESGWLCGTGCFLVRVTDPSVDNRFLSHFASTDGVVAWLTANAAGAIMPNLNNVVLGNLPVVIPPIDEQLEIVAILDAIDRQIDVHKRKRAILEELFKALLHKLMTGEIAVADLDLSRLPTTSAVTA